MGKGGLGRGFGQKQSQALSEDSRNAAELVAERPDIMFDVKNVSENLQSPKYRHWQQVKRIVRYLAGTRDYVQKVEVNSEVNANKSAKEHSLVGWITTSCAVLKLNGAVTQTHSRKQTFIEHGRGRNVRNFVGHI